jgi:hypothetical protein
MNIRIEEASGTKSSTWGKISYEERILGVSAKRTHPSRLRDFLRQAFSNKSKLLSFFLSIYSSKASINQFDGDFPLLGK